VASLFSDMIAGNEPAQFIYRDDRVVVVMAPAPVRAGHAIVVPREEVDHWIDVDPDLMQHLCSVAQLVGAAIQARFEPKKVGLAILGLQVRHTHVHLVPMQSAEDLTLSNGDPDTPPHVIAEAAEQLRAELRARGCTFVAD